MAEELQGLLNRIQQDGLEKSEAERAKIIADAEAKAAKIVADAEAAAKEITDKASSAASAMEEKAKASIRQAARDVVIALKCELLARLERVTRETVSKAMTPEEMAQIVNEMVKSYAANPSDKVEVLLPQAVLFQMESSLRNALTFDLQSRTKILGEQELNGGLQIGFRDGSVFLDFSDDALADLICAYVGPKLTSILKD